LGRERTNVGDTVSTVIAPPSLATNRLLLEPLSRRHSPGMYLLWSREEVCRYSGPALDWAGGPITLPAENPTDSDKIIDFFERRAAEGTGFRWAVIAQQGGEFAGAVGFNGLKPAAELAFHLRPEFWGRGIMREAAEAALEWVRANRPGVAVEAYIEPGNAASIGLAQRLGFRADGATSGEAARFVLRT
jgi:ribosomal-protein-alanine N-acetyltransferase